MCNVLLVASVDNADFLSYDFISGYCIQVSLSPEVALSTSRRLSKVSKLSNKLFCAKL